MLGLITSGQQWSWCVCGKHPMARDFLCFGRTSSLATSMAEWVDKGYSTVTVTMKPGQQPRFWRFWARGIVADELVCGLLRDSSDSIGRKYPLLVLGSGPIASWKAHWDLLPGACERAWNRIEYLCTRNPPDLGGMERELLTTRPPEPDWRDFHATREAGMKVLQHSPAVRLIDARLNILREEQEFRMALDNDISDHLVLASHFLSRIKADGKGPPNTVFIGGTFDATCLAIYWRPLVVGDFIALWGVTNENAH